MVKPPKIADFLMKLRRENWVFFELIVVGSTLHKPTFFHNPRICQSQFQDATCPAPSNHPDRRNVTSVTPNTPDSRIPKDSAPPEESSYTGKTDTMDKLPPGRGIRPEPEDRGLLHRPWSVRLWQGSPST